MHKLLSDRAKFAVGAPFWDHTKQVVIKIVSKENIFIPMNGFDNRITKVVKKVSISEII
jgi:hypothetical protein